jgi:hypothetical protein
LDLLPTAGVEAFQINEILQKHFQLPKFPNFIFSNTFSYIISSISLIFLLKIHLLWGLYSGSMPCACVSCRWRGSLSPARSFLLKSFNFRYFSDVTSFSDHGVTYYFSAGNQDDCRQPWHLNMHSNTPEVSNVVHHPSKMNWRFRILATDGCYVRLK